MNKILQWFREHVIYSFSKNDDITPTTTYVMGDTITTKEYVSNHLPWKVGDEVVFFEKNLPRECYIMTIKEVQIDISGSVIISLGIDGSETQRSIFLNEEYILNKFHRLDNGEDLPLDTDYDTYGHTFIRSIESVEKNPTMILNYINSMIEHEEYRKKTCSVKKMRYDMFDKLVENRDLPSLIDYFVYMEKDEMLCERERFEAEYNKCLSCLSELEKIKKRFDKA